MRNLDIEGAFFSFGVDLECEEFAVDEVVSDDGSRVGWGSRPVILMLSGLDISISTKIKSELD